MMAKEVAAAQSKRRVQSIEVGFRVLRVLRMAEGPLPLREIAARADMPPSKVHLYLVSFVRENMAYQDLKTGHYGLGSFAIQLGLAAVRQLDVVSLAADMLNELRDQSDCAIYLSLWGDQGPCIVSKADGSLQGAFAVRLGFILPLATTATGLVFLAHLPKQETKRALEAQSVFAQSSFTQSSKSDGGLAKKEHAQAVADVLRLGYASTTGQLQRNFSGISVPVFDYGNNLAAAVTMLGPVDFMTDARKQQFSGLMLNAAQGLSQRLGAPAGTAEPAAS